MKTLLAVALVGMAISFALPILAQQKEPTLSEQDRQQIAAMGKKMLEALNNNDAAALAALFTEDAVIVTDKGTVNGRMAIEKWYADDFQEWHHSNHTGNWDSNSPRLMGTVVVESGAWSATIQGKSGGPIQLEGYYSHVDAREGNDWKVRMLTYNITPAPAATPSPTASPSNQ